MVDQAHSSTADATNSSSSGAANDTAPTTSPAAVETSDTADAATHENDQTETESHIDDLDSILESAAHEMFGSADSGSAAADQSNTEHQQQLTIEHDDPQSDVPGAKPGVCT